MIHITDVELIDFQAHHHTRLSFVDGSNGLVGSSEAGKSSILRAIQWCLTNHFSGNKFIRIGAKRTIVRVTLSNGYTIERQRGRTATNNFYRLYEGDVMVKEFTAFGRNVPRDISDIHGMDLDRNLSLNFHHQLETAFLLNLSPARRAEVIGNLDELSRIDRAQDKLNEELTGRSGELRQMDADIEAIEIEAKRLRARLDAQSAKKQTLIDLSETIEEEAETVERLTRIVMALDACLSSIREYRAEYDRCAKAAIGFSEDFRPADVNRLHALYQLSQSDQERMRILEREAQIEVDALNERRDYVDSHFAVTSRLDELAQRVDATQQEKLRHLPYLSDEVRQVVDHDFSTLDQNLEQYQTMFEHYKRVEKVAEFQEQFLEQIDASQKESDDLIDEMLQLLTESGQCFVCGQSTKELTHECLEQTI